MASETQYKKCQNELKITKEKLSTFESNVKFNRKIFRSLSKILLWVNECNEIEMREEQ